LVNLIFLLLIKVFFLPCQRLQFNPASDSIGMFSLRGKPINITRNLICESKKMQNIFFCSSLHSSHRIEISIWGSDFDSILQHVSQTRTQINPLAFFNKTRMKVKQTFKVCKWANIGRTKEIIFFHSTDTITIMFR
jgi:hypothetical protein